MNYNKRKRYYLYKSTLVKEKGAFIRIYLVNIACCVQISSLFVYVLEWISTIPVYCWYSYCAMILIFFVYCFCFCVCYPMCLPTISSYTWISRPTWWLGLDTLIHEITNDWIQRKQLMTKLDIYIFTDLPTDIPS